MVASFLNGTASSVIVETCLPFSSVFTSSFTTCSVVVLSAGTVFSSSVGLFEQFLNTSTPITTTASTARAIKPIFTILLLYHAGLPLPLLPTFTPATLGVTENSTICAVMLSFPPFCRASSTRASTRACDLMVCCLLTILPISLSGTIPLKPSLHSKKQSPASGRMGAAATVAGRISARPSALVMTFFCGWCSACSGVISPASTSICT